ncbi:PREDICTED: uncharacterized protein LOC105948688 [Erythranthe guttata]|uniref:uncharacterized protein LOC105948688 n=1 Tax=Erythranthe guttata TaxID=4155 RepID=UPI00064DE946|nr:PREDICTED: uncharacterized protein LOC105948688 [Erythranthe guttata]|eukprot:XP_012827373.1 PREDICTED: uncharacterized protein LOC105948688 [Erythranthe guttata]
MVLSKTSTASDLWNAISSLFTDNKDYRAIQLEEKFKSLKKGALSIHDYCQIIKTTADSLADVGNPISDKQLVLQTLHGLPKNYGTVANLISFQNPLPTFLQTRSLLQMEETRISEPEQTAAVFYASNANCPSNSCNSSRGGSSSRYQRGGGRSNRRGGRNTNRHPMQHYGYHSAHGASQLWRAPYRQQSILGSAQNTSGHPAAQAYFTGPPEPYTGHSAPTQVHPQQQPCHSSGSSINSCNSSCNSANVVDLAHRLNTVTLQQPTESQWFMDSGATSHMAPHSGNFNFFFNPGSKFPKHVVVGNGSTLPITHIGHTILPTTHFRLTNVYVTPNIVKHLISVRKFTRDNSCSVEFDPFGFSVKDLRSRVEIFRCNSSGDLYPFGVPPPTSPPAAFLTVATSSSRTLWHRRLGHPGKHVMSRLFSSTFLSHNKDPRESLCNACQLGKHFRLPFFSQKSTTVAPF